MRTILQLPKDIDLILQVTSDLAKVIEAYPHADWRSIFMLMPAIETCEGDLQIEVDAPQRDYDNGDLEVKKNLHAQVLEFFSILCDLHATRDTKSMTEVVFAWQRLEDVMANHIDSISTEGCGINNEVFYLLSGVKAGAAEYAEAFDGEINLMDLAGSAARSFVVWASNNVEFDNLDDPWCYLLEDDVAPVLLKLIASKKPINEDSYIHICNELNLTIIPTKYAK